MDCNSACDREALPEAKHWEAKLLHGVEVWFQLFPTGVWSFIKLHDPNPNVDNNGQFSIEDIRIWLFLYIQ